MVLIETLKKEKLFIYIVGAIIGLVLTICSMSYQNINNLME